MEGRFLFITSRLNIDKNGGYLGSKRNLENLQSIFGEKLDVFNIKSTNFKRIINIVFFKRLELISLRAEKQILSEIKKNKYKIIFLDNSGYGYLCENIKIKFPDIKIITFCHDINLYLFSSILKEYEKDKNGIKKFLRIVKLYFEKRNAKLNEIKTFKYSDVIITLNNRDSQLLKKIYKKDSNAEIGVTLKSNNNQLYKKSKEKKLKILFVGTASLKANVTGIEFFIDKVLKYLTNIELNIVGKGFEKYKESFENKNKSINVIGTVEKIDEYYIANDIIIAPIFAGGGMKIKTAEALSYGKTIFGTKEAFEGYEVDYEKVGGLCNTAEEFIEAITKYIELWKISNKSSFNEYSYQIFKEKYSYEASIKKFEEIFKKLEREESI